jgi:hypothetical protein
LTSDFPPITDEIPEDELEAEPDHIGLDDEGNPEGEDDTEA